VNPRDEADDDDPRELARASPLRPLDGPEAVAHLLAQSNRESAANRAQARELIKALEGVQRSQEFLGVALREEKRRSRWLLALVILAPIAAAAGVWWVAARVDDVRTDVSDRMAKLASDEQAARAESAQRLRDVRIDELASDLAGLRTDLTASRDAAAAQERQLAQREAALAAAEGRTDSARTEIGALEFEVRSAKAKANAEQARAAQLEDRIKELQSELDARRKAPAQPAPAEAARPAPPPATDAAAPAAAASKAPSPEPKAAAAAAKAPAEPASDPAETEKVRRALNGLLREADDAVRYEIQALGGAAGRTLTALRVVGTDERGAVVRTIQAGRAEISIDTTTGSIVLRFVDGKLIVGTVEAPFFDGSYGVVVRGDAAKWKSAGLTCVGTQ
jgi:hypothetical protein